MGNLKTWTVAAAVGLLAGGAVFATTSGPLAVDITEKGFSPEKLSTKLGEKVMWTNKTAVEQRMTATLEKPAAPQEEKETPVFDSGVIKPGDTFEHTFARPGTYVVELQGDAKLSGRVVVSQEEK